MEHVRNNERLERMEQMIAGINETLSRFGSNPTSARNNPDNSWSLPNEASANVTSSIRWDHVKPFPIGIPANKMWEEWNRYIEKFEIAVSLSNMNPAKQTQLLYLSMGTELQEIVKAGKLRRPFVTNIKNYFRSMTDTAAEHEAFSRMKQESGESAVAFHARLMCKVPACNYSGDEDKFVHAQLLKGLRNRELVRQARIHQFDTNCIVQSATREDAFEAEIRQQEGSNVFEVRRAQGYPPSTQRNRKHPNFGSRADEPPTKQYRSNNLNQRSQENRQRCTRCFQFRHRNGQCPALGRSCNHCGKRGHFAAACRQKRVNTVRYEQHDGSLDKPAFSDEEKHDDKKQVMNI